MAGALLFIHHSNQRRRKLIEALAIHLFLMNYRSCTGLLSIF